MASVRAPQQRCEQPTRTLQTRTRCCCAQSWQSTACGRRYQRVTPGPTWAVAAVATWGSLQVRTKPGAARAHRAWTTMLLSMLAPRRTACRRRRRGRGVAVATGAPVVAAAAVAQCWQRASALYRFHFMPGISSCLPACALHCHKTRFDYCSYQGLAHHEPHRLTLPA